jgi:predicted ATPase
VAGHNKFLDLHASLMARLDRLGSAKVVAQIAAVLGREFAYPLIRAVAGSSETVLAAALERLAEADLIHAQGMPPDSTYRFKHTLVQDAAYESLLKSRRRELHRAAARALNDEFQETAEAQPELLAYHLTEAGENEAAIAAWQRAGEGALHRAAYIEASKHLGKAIELAEGLGDGPADRLLQLRLQIAYGQALIHRGDMARRRQRPPSPAPPSSRLASKMRPSASWHGTACGLAALSAASPRQCGRCLRPFYATPSANPTRPNSCGGIA